MVRMSGVLFINAFWSVVCISCFQVFMTGVKTTGVPGQILIRFFNGIQRMTSGGKNELPVKKN